MTEDERTASRPKDDESVLITLNDDSQIEADAYQHVRVEEPSDFVFGMGQQMKKYTGQEYQFKGKLKRTALDSAKILGVNGVDHLKCWLPDTTVILFKHGDYLVVAPDAGTGYMLHGTRSREWEDSTFHGVIPFSEIKEIELQKLSGIKTGAFLLVVLPIAAWITMGLMLLSNPL